jgi:hypothetical protein
MNMPDVRTARPEGRAFRVFVDPPNGYCREVGDGRPDRADFFRNRRGNFDGETGAVRNGAAILISARVGAWGEELLDEIGVRAVNLDTATVGAVGVKPTWPRGRATLCLRPAAR